MKKCGELWTKFEKEGIVSIIPDKLSDEVLAVYHEYEGDYTQPFSYFIGCKVPEGIKTPEGLDSLTIQAGPFQKIAAKGEMPGCIADTWREIWESDILLIKPILKFMTSGTVTGAMLRWIFIYRFS